MGLKGNLIAEFEIRSSGDLFYELIAFKPYLLPKISPANIQGCHLLKGQFGKNGSVLFWNYTNNGKASVAKDILENLDEVNNTITFREIGGDLVEIYKTFLIHLHVKSEGDKISVVDWSLEYEKLQEDTPHPTTFLEMLLNLSKDIENHHLKP